MYCNLYCKEISNSMTKTNLTESAESNFIDYLVCQLGKEYLGDDCAVIDNNYLITSDSQVEGCHFSLDYFKLYEVGRRLVLINVSDIASMAGIPKYIQIILNIPKVFDQYSIKQVYKGIIDTCAEYKITITGGNTTSSQHDLALSATLLGLKHDLGVCQRFNYKNGYDVVVTGTSGLSYTGLKHLENGCRDLTLASVSRHLNPVPRLDEAITMLEITKNNLAMIDTSDSVYESILHLYKISELGFNINPDLLPISPETINLSGNLGINPQAVALFGGEDFELLVCLPADLYIDINKAFKMHGYPVQLTKIGQVINNKEVNFNNLNDLGKFKDKILYKHLQ